MPAGNTGPLAQYNKKAGFNSGLSATFYTENSTKSYFRRGAADLRLSATHGPITAIFVVSGNKLPKTLVPCMSPFVGTEQGRHAPGTLDNVFPVRSRRGPGESPMLAGPHGRHTGAPPYPRGCLSGPRGRTAGRYRGCNYRRISNIRSYKMMAKHLVLGNRLDCGSALRFSCRQLLPTGIPCLTG